MISSLKSKIVREVLNYFFLHSEDSLYLNELVRKLKLDKRNLVKKLKELEEAGLIRSEKRGNQKYYFLNKKFPLYKEYRNIVMKTIGLEGKLKNILRNIKGIKKAYIYGSYAKDRMDAFSDIDLLVVGNHDTIVLQGEISKLQKEIDREINVVSMGEREFNLKKKSKDPFISRILKDNLIEIYDGI